MVLAVVGVILLAAPSIPWLGRLPGDFAFRGDRVTVYVPLATSILLSILLTILLNFFWR